MIKKRVLLAICVLVIFILNSAIIFALEGTTQEWDTTNTNNYKDPEFYKNTEPSKWNYKDENFGWGKVPDDKIPAVPKENLEMGELKDSQLKKVTADQLVYGTPPNLDLVDSNNLDSVARSEALRRLGRATQVQSDTGGQPTHITSYDDGFGIDRIASLQIDGVTIINGVNVEYHGGNLTADHADSFIQGSSITTNIENLDSSLEQFSVGSADTLISNGVTINNIQDTTFIVSEGRIEIQPADDVSLEIEDSNYAETTFTAVGDNSKLVIEGDKYSVTNGSVEFEGVDYNETIEASNTAVATVDPSFGFECINFTPLGFYKYDDSTGITKFFALKVWKEAHKVCIRKDISQSFALEERTTVVDLVDKKIDINGVIELLKFHFHSLSFVDFLLHSVFRPENNITAELLFKPELNYFQNATIKVNSFAEVNNWLSFNDSETARIFYINNDIDILSETMFEGYYTGVYSAYAEDNLFRHEAGNTTIDFYFPGSEPAAVIEKRANKISSIEEFYRKGIWGFG